MHAEAHLLVEAQRAKGQPQHVGVLLADDLELLEPGQAPIGDMRRHVHRLQGAQPHWPNQRVVACRQLRHLQAQDLPPPFAVEAAVCCVGIRFGDVEGGEPVEGSLCGLGGALELFGEFGGAPTNALRGHQAPPYVSDLRTVASRMQQSTLARLLVAASEVLRQGVPPKVGRRDQLDNRGLRVILLRRFPLGHDGVVGGALLVKLGDVLLEVLEGCHAVLLRELGAREVPAVLPAPLSQVQARAVAERVVEQRAVEEDLVLGLGHAVLVGKDFVEGR